MDFLDARTVSSFIRGTAVLLVLLSININKFNKFNNRIRLISLFKKYKNKYMDANILRNSVYKSIIMHRISNIFDSIAMLWLLLHIFPTWFLLSKYWYISWLYLILQIYITFFTGFYGSFFPYHSFKKKKCCFVGIISLIFTFILIFIFYM